MPNVILLLAVFAATFLIPIDRCAADDTNKPAEKLPAEASKSKDEKGEPKERKVESTHSITLNGQKFDYTAQAGTVLLRDKDDKPTAEIFYIAYTRAGVSNLAERPVTFSFNGGPGSSSVWLHMGLLGPRKVHLEDDGHPVPPPYRLVDNEYSLLDETDLVFIDPVSTGYSRAIKADDAKQFHGVEADIRSVAEFIRLYTTRNSRWPSPKFIIGESYGTTRAAGLSGELRERFYLNVNGIMLVSTVLNFQTLHMNEGNDLPYVLYFPSYSATAWYHHKLATDLQNLPLKDVLAKAETFAAGGLNRALLMGDALPADQRLQAVKDYAQLTGISESYVDRAGLRIPLSRFNEELLRGENRVLGRFDSRYSGYVRDRNANDMPYDPSGAGVFPAFASAFNQYVRTELKYEQDAAYEILNGEVGPWKWASENQYLNVATTLADSLTQDPFLKVHVSAGYFDLATPYFATRYTFNHLGIDPKLAANITVDEYTAGHMMYLNLPDLKKQRGDLGRFIRSASGR
jgi:carboxypeptidase C (cathepsin A)